LQPQSARVDCPQTDSVAWQSDAAQYLSDFVWSEDHREFLLARRSDEVEDGPLSVQSLLEEELDAANGDGAGGPRPLLDILDVEEVLSEFFLGDEVGRLVIVLGEQSHGPNVHLLCALGEASKLKRLDHSLSEFSHVRTSCCGIWIFRKYKQHFEGEWSLITRALSYPALALSSTIACNGARRAGFLRSCYAPRPLTQSVIRHDTAKMAKLVWDVGEAVIW
jgi:hypothetical protein